MSQDTDAWLNRPLRQQILRGPEENRIKFIPKEGELIYTTDSKRLYVGDGSTYGGILVNPFISLEWNFTSVVDQTEYTPDVDEPLFRSTTDGIYLVFYGAVKLFKNDYTIEDNTFTLLNAPEESGIPISIHYFGL